MMIGNKRTLESRKTIGDDKIFAQLTDMFGDTVPTEIILRVGHQTKWHLDQCIEKLIKFNSDSIKRPMAAAETNNWCADDADDADVLIESDELHVKNELVESTVSHPSTNTGAIKKSNSAKSFFESFNQQQQQQIMPNIFPTNSQFKIPRKQQITSAVQPSMSFSSYLQENISDSSNTDEHGFSSPFRKNKQPRLTTSTGGVHSEHPQMAEIIREIKQNYRVMICMRGAPGSGKSYLARSIIDRTMNGDYANHIFSTDDFFYDRRTKKYNYDRSMLGQAHDSNQFRVAQRAMNGWSPIIIDNTNMKLWEMLPYVRYGLEHGYIIKLLEPNTPWAKSVGKLTQKNKHNVDRDTIMRMLTNYESGSVQDILRLMQVKNFGAYPRLRSFPQISDAPKIEQMAVDANANDLDEQKCNTNTASVPKEQRTRHNVKSNSNTADENTATEANSFQVAFKSLETLNDEWPAFEEEQDAFWNSSATDAVAKPKVASDAMLPKPQRNPMDMYRLLQDEPDSKIGDEAQSKGAKESTLPEQLKKHQKNCPNENKSFQQIRNIYPTIPLLLLWDLFEKCKGDGDWTMDILLNENETNEFRKLETQEEIDNDNFQCGCSSSSGLDSGLQQAANVIPMELINENRSQVPAPTHSMRPIRRPKPERMTTESEVLKQIEEQFVISDEHYTNRMRKVRDFRRGINPSNNNNAPATNAVQSAPAVTSNTIKPSESTSPIEDTAAADDELIEMDLGIELVCQLDSVFGAKAFQRDALKGISTKVFMPRVLGQQLHAIWMESLYNQIEEQRQQTIKDDEAFAREFLVKQTYPQLFQETESKNQLTDIVDMEYVWKAYTTNANDWKQTTPEDLATKLTKVKLFEIFPNVDRETLVEVFAAHGNIFSKTVDFFRDSLRSDIGNVLQAKSQELLTQARIEAQAIRPEVPTHVNASKYNETNHMNKLDLEDAKRAALKDFEENRNMAMHHSHLKAECYNKAREAFQRRQQAVAYYYSNVANLHNTKIDMYNHMAANAIVEVHSYTQQNPEMLDLHYLHASEAVECLDIFLDRHVKELKDAVKGFKYVFIITGRGLHSTGGFSTIKHRVKSRLRERSLSWAEVNPGLLKVKLQFISIFAQETNKS